MIPSPTDLIYFVEVANRLNISRAAESLGISQPSLTLSMNRIETAIGISLLIRHKRGVSLTKAGKQLLAHTRQLLEQWDTVKAETLASTNKIQGYFIIGCHSSLGVYTLPKFLANLIENNPKLEIELKHDISRKITEEIINLKMDIGIVVNPVKHPDLVIKPLDIDKVSLWKNASKRKNLDLHSGSAVLLCDPNLTQTQAILKKLKKQKIKYDRLIASNSLEVIADLTKSGCGIGILPANVAASRELISIPKMPFYQDEICLIYRGENRNVKGIQIIINSIKDAFAK